jgi:RHS repeat-associated protein
MLWPYRGKECRFGEYAGLIGNYYPFGVCRNSPENFPTDRLFTGQRLDDTGLYYYGARYYDATIGRFISADTIIPNPANPQSFNRYSYCLNNPLKYIDPSGLNVILPNGWDVEDIEAMRGNIFYLPTDLQQLIYEIINSTDYQTYLELKQDETNQIEEMENSDETYVFIIDNDLDEDEHDAGYNVAYFFSSSNSKRYRWNQDPAWWQDPEWQRDWFYKAGEKLAVVGRIAKGGVEISGGAIIALIGVGDLVVVTATSFGFASFISVPSGLYLIGQGYNIIAGGVSDISLGTLNPPAIPWLPNL